MKSFTVTSTKTYTPQWVLREYTTYNEVYRTVRSKFPYKGDTCFKCQRQYDDGEKIGIAHIIDVGNRSVCQLCADSLL